MRCIQALALHNLDTFVGVVASPQCKHTYTIVMGGPGAQKKNVGLVLSVVSSPVYDVSMEYISWNIFLRMLYSVPT